MISPWNAPFLLMAWKVGPALACGNTVVHGFGPDAAGEFITRHEQVDASTFTGETRTGTTIMKAAAEGIFRSAFMNTGQVCLGTERVDVERPVFDRFVAALKARCEAVKYGRPADAGANYGPLISQEHRHKVLGYDDKAVAEGATVVTGGGVPPPTSRPASRSSTLASRTPWPTTPRARPWCPSPMATSSCAPLAACARAASVFMEGALHELHMAAPPKKRCAPGFSPRRHGGVGQGLKPRHHGAHDDPGSAPSPVPAVRARQRLRASPKR